jgi:multiple sugar transport system substrate-binding protein
MATIKDIARVAGVSQGTVSNVLNGKGNVSSQKILLVEEAARALGYTMNERARLLRKGSSKILALILPNPDDRQYVDFQTSFSAYAESAGYTIDLYFSGDQSEREKAIIARIKSSMASGIASFSALGNEASSFYKDSGFKDHQVLFVERMGGANFLGFDYSQAADDIARFIQQESVDRITVLMEETATQDELFYDELKQHLGSEVPVRYVRTNDFTRKSKIFGLLEESEPVVVCTHLGLAKQCRSILTSFFPDSSTRIIPLAPMTTLPDQDFYQYELNFRYLGRKAAEHLLRSVKNQKIEQFTLKNAGFRNWSTSPMIIKGSPSTLRMLLLESPPSFALQHLARLYTRSTGVSIEIDIATYESINEILINEHSASRYDILRVGADVLSWDAPLVLRPLDEIDYEVNPIYDSLIGGIEGPFTHVEGKRYALPISPSLQVLYYRKDLFDKTVLRRLYQEQYRETLAVPKTFAQYNRIASFFSLSQNSHSPVQYGSTLVLGKTPILAGTEFMTRYFSYAQSLFSNGLPLLLSDEAEQSIADILALRSSVNPSLKWWTEAAEAFANGQSAMTILFSNFASDFFSKTSLVSDKIGFSMIPGGRPLLGGGSLGVSKHSRHPQEALRFISWLVSEPVSSAVALLGGNPITQETLTNYEVIETYPWMEMLATGFSKALGQRVPSADNAPFNDHKFVALLGKAVWSCWFDYVKPKEALKSAYHQYCLEQDSYI